MNLFNHWLDVPLNDLEGATCLLISAVAYRGCSWCSTKFMYSNPLSIEEFLFAFRILYVFGFIRDVFCKLNFNALSSVCNLFGEAKKTKSLLAFWHHYSFTWRKMFRNAHTLQKPIEKHLFLTSPQVTFVSYKRSFT